MLVLLLLILSTSSTDGCLSTGCGGGGGGCCGGGCQQPAPCVQSCQTGYTCGQYGCAKARAHSALTHKDGFLLTDEEFDAAAKAKNNIFGVAREVSSIKKINESMFIQLTNPNYLFRQCCEARKLPDACLSKCHFNSYTQQSLQSMFLKNDNCPIEAAADIQYCAAQGRDHRDCCAKNGVQNTIAGQKCMVFCDQRPGKITQLSWDYVPCYDRFENMKRCFYDEVRIHSIQRYTPLLEKKG